MAWEDPGVTKNMRLSNGTATWGPGGTPLNIPIQQTGILREMRVITSGTVTEALGGGTSAVDVLGPGNLYTQVVLSPNQQSPILQCRGHALGMIQYLLSNERNGAQPYSDLAAILQGSPDAAYFLQPLGSGVLTYGPLIPVAQKIRTLGGHVGFWPLQNPAVQLQLSLTPNSPTAATPFALQSVTAGAAPYLVTGAATELIATPTVDVIRDLWSVPDNEKDTPLFNVASTWVEETPQTFTTTRFQWNAPSLIGLIVRLGAFVFNSTTGAGIAAGSMTASNAIGLYTDNDAPKFVESAAEALGRQKDFYGSPLPLGLFAYDLLGADLTLQDVLDTNNVANIKLIGNFSTAVGAASYAYVLRQVISPLVIR
jgi:hypothetical protein